LFSYEKNKKLSIYELKIITHKTIVDTPTYEKCSK